MGFGLEEAQTVGNLASRRQLLSPKQLSNHHDIVADDSGMLDGLCPLTSPLLSKRLIKGYLI